MNINDIFLVAAMLIAALNNVSLVECSNKNLVHGLKERYNNTAMQCETESGKKLPAYYCSGIMIRGIGVGKQLKSPWSMKPFNKEKESFAVAFLRQDAEVREWPRSAQSGFIIYPHLKTPEAKTTQKALCAFPIDGKADQRTGRHACGKSKRDNTNGSDLCEKQGITTFEKWRTDYNTRNRRLVLTTATYMPDYKDFQCGFDMTTPKAPEFFEIVLRAKKFLMDYVGPHPYIGTEMRLHSWDESDAKKIPIEAFFFLAGSESGLSEAKRYQALYKEESGGEVVPIVGIQLPQSKIFFQRERKFKVASYDERNNTWVWE